MSTNIIDQLRERGLVRQTVYEDELKELLDSGSQSFYIGFDPTADSLHVGHFMQLIVARRLQQAGHRPIILVGGGTGMIGDPSGRTDLRSVMTRETVAHNVECFKKQMARFIDFEGENGALMVQGTLNGIGERNGNANLCTIIPNLSLKMNRELSCSANLKKLRDLSLFVDEMANLRSNTRLPYVGSSSFAHKGGVHADAANKVKRSYEHIDPSLVGNKTRVLVSDMSGRASVMMKARDMGLDVNQKDPAIKEFLDELKELEFRGYEYEAADASFGLLLAKYLKKYKPHFKVRGYRAIVERDELAGTTKSEATVKLEIDGNIEHTVAEAHGPVAALDLALRKALVKKFPSIKSMDLTDFKVRIIDSGAGTNAITRVMIESKDSKGEIWGTVGASDNIIVASWEALKDSFEYKLSKED